ncbi:double-strand break repair protein AddB [Paracoccus sediminis]|uniref:Double-strand break repair protein AddB n=1 Tax=Paracoccus sediminis TaxID=1214787 RepID=A0A238VEM2_9RHOB|nr:double-strand break repair protein AddB [Paracoccus sediminis]TBN51976.1 double-strand break repair protein AddB [Paracoccus sediminis]SNR32604.1 double-strand break repair protein AddB [Paracoccus sediminis]
MAEPAFRGLYALPSGIDFAHEVVAGFLDRMAGRPPEAMARVTIYANAALTLSELKCAFDLRGPLLLPRLLPVTNLEIPAMLGQAETAPLARRLQLARLVAKLLETRRDLAAGHSIASLARSLSGLMQEMQYEGLSPDALEGIDTGDHARHWQNALAFLRIAARFHLDGPPVDRAARQRLASETLCRDWGQGVNLPGGPVIVVGSTGSHGATRMFMEAVAALPEGAVILPGFDFDQPQAVWDGLDHKAEDHPQARFAPLIAALGRPARWTGTAPPVPARNRLISLALRPAPVTDQWIAEGPRLPDLIPATEGLTLIEADQPGTEAEVIALILRDAAERAERATLIAADGNLIRRVNAALDRWHLRADESAGQPLALTAPGLFLRQVAALFGQPLTIDRLLVLLKHPLSVTGSAAVPANEARRLARDLELELRRNGPAFPDGPCLRDWGSRGDGLRKIWADWLAALLDRITPLAADRAARPLPDRLRDLIALAETLAAGPDGDPQASKLWEEKRGALLRASIDHLSEHAHEGPALGATEFCALLLDEIGQQSVRVDAETTFHLIHIRGPREARIVGRGTVILSGLNEGGWPQPLSPDPWLSRQMRTAAGLPLPERLIGLAAHDFQQAMGLSRVVLTRARRDAEAETIPSRWLNRLTNLMGGLPDRNGPQALAAMRARGDRWLAQAAAVSRPPAILRAAARPSPIPPAPPFRELPVTDVSLLIRDPYAVYAKRVLGLRPLPPLRPEPDASLRGQTLHSIVEAMVASKPAPGTPHADLKAQFLRLTDTVLARDVPWPAARAFWAARMGRIADQICADELARLAEGQPVVVEKRGKVRVPGMDFVLTAQPDRIDLLGDGQVMIYDYKSGKPPSDRQIAAFDKQLILEAAMARRGGFDALGPAEVAGIRYIHLGGEGETQPRAYSPDLETENWDGFVRLIAAYLSGETGFTAMRAPEQMGYAGDYDHLARYGEWSLADAPQVMKVGDGE